MGVSTLTALAVAHVLVVAVGIGLIVVVSARRSRTSSGAWRAQAAALARDLHDALDGRDPPLDAEDVGRAVLPLVGRFESLARDAPADVDATLQSRFYRLGVACRRLGIEYPHRDPRRERSYADLVADVADRADRVARDLEASRAEVTG